MKRFLFIFILFIIPFFSFAQVRAVTTDVHGQISVVVALPRGGHLEMNQYGKVLSMDSHGLRVEYYSGFRDYEAGKIKRIGDIYFRYHSDFRGYEAGKIESIGGVRFNYHSDFRRHEAGKIESIGRVRFDYYSDFWDYEAGKIRSIGSHRYRYSSHGRYRGSLESGVPSFETHGIAFRVIERHIPSRPHPTRPNYYPHREHNSIRDRDYRY